MDEGGQCCSKKGQADYMQSVGPRRQSGILRFWNRTQDVMAAQIARTVRGYRETPGKDALYETENTCCAEAAKGETKCDVCDRRTHAGFDIRKVEILTKVHQTSGSSEWMEQFLKGLR